MNMRRKHCKLYTERPSVSTQSWNLRPNWCKAIAQTAHHCHHCTALKMNQKDSIRKKKKKHKINTFLIQSVPHSYEIFIKWTVEFMVTVLKVCSSRAQGIFVIVPNTLSHENDIKLSFRDLWCAAVSKVGCAPTENWEDKKYLARLWPWRENWSKVASENSVKMVNFSWRFTLEPVLFWTPHHI